MFAQMGLVFVIGLLFGIWLGFIISLLINVEK